MTGLRYSERGARTILATSAALFMVSACSKAPQRQMRPTATVAVAPVKRATVPYNLDANGVVMPLQSAAVSAQVDGIVQDVLFQEGQEVTKGQVLFKIDPRPYQAAYQTALANLERDQANYANAKSAYDRYQKLIELRYITKDEGDTRQATAQSTEAIVKADEAQVEQAKFNLDNTAIRAPISGKTGGLLVRKGNLVRAGAATQLVVINQIRPILVRFAVPSTELPTILQYGAKGGLPVTATPSGASAPVAQPLDAPASPTAGGLAAAAAGDPPAGAGGAVDGVADPRGAGGSRGAAAQPAVQQQSRALPAATGSLSFIDNAVDTTTGTVQLKATFANGDGRLWVGQFAATTLHLYDEQNALVVPAQAVVTGQRGTYVYVVDASDTARQKPVVVERTAAGLAVITSGVSEGDRVVTDGQSRLTPNSPVQIRTGSESPDMQMGGGRGRGGRGGRGGPGAGPGGGRQRGDSGRGNFGARGRPQS